MKKYSSGYTLCSILSIFGISVIGLSGVIGFFFFVVYISADIPGGTPLLGLGLLSIIFGFFQGITSIGMGAIGRAILDGSTAQQELFEKIEMLTIGAKDAVQPLTSWQPYSEAKSHGRIDQASTNEQTDLKVFRQAGNMQAFRDEPYLGINVRYYYEIGEYVVDGYSFYSSEDAQNYIKHRRTPN